MIYKWVKLLPYWLVMRLCRNDNSQYGTLNHYRIKYFQIDEGEFVVFSKEVQDIFDKRRREEREKKREKKKYKLLAKINNDFDLKQDIEEYYKKKLN
jgi:hypothetical protein